MTRNSARPDTITAFRTRIASLVQDESASARRRHVIALALDGIPYELARRAWSRASIERLRSVFPSTSSSAWLSSLTGMSVASHGVPGVVFTIPEWSAKPVNVFAHRGPLFDGDIENVFSDAARYGYVPISVLGDLNGFDCTWRDLLVRHSRAVAGESFYVGRRGGPPAPRALCRELRDTLESAIRTIGCGAPCLVWCLIDVDHHIHRHGYDEHVIEVLRSVEAMAVELGAANAIVVAHSDHGLTRTAHDPRVASLVERVCAAHGAPLGGAGRTRWIYAADGAAREVGRALRADLPDSIDVRHADELFTPGSLARRRVGEIVLIARGDTFMTPAENRYEHGSLGDDELDVPCAVWCA